MKTAMETMLTYIKAVETEEFNQELEYIKENCIQLIDREKQQIIDAYNAGSDDPFGYRGVDDYIETTYRTNKETLK
jgi:hypothetical protein